MLDDLDLTSIADERLRTLIVRLLNLIDAQASDLRDAQAEIQRLRDENNRLKGEQGKPNITPPSPPPPPSNYSSEAERSRRVERGKRGKRASIIVDREQILTVDRRLLPPDAEFKGYEGCSIQGGPYGKTGWGLNEVFTYKGKPYKSGETPAVAKDNARKTEVNKVVKEDPPTAPRPGQGTRGKFLELLTKKP